MVCLAAFVFHVYRALGTGEDFDLAVDLIDGIAFTFFVARPKPMTATILPPATHGTK